MVGVDPQSTGVLCARVAGGPGSGGEPPVLGSCPPTLDPVVYRSRERTRECKDR